MAVDLGGQGVQIQRDLFPRALAAEAGAVGRPGTEHFDQCLAVLRLAQGRHQPGERGLRRQPLGLPPVTPPKQGTLASPFRNRQAEGRIAAKEVHVSLAAPPLGRKQHRCTKEFSEGMGDQVRVAEVHKRPLDQLPEPQPLAHLPQQHGPGVRREVIGRRAQLHGVVEFQRKQRTLIFTHGVSPLRRSSWFFRTSNLLRRKEIRHGLFTFRICLVYPNGELSRLTVFSPGGS